MAARRKANAKLLSDLLQDVGYHKKLSPSGLEWAFEHPETRNLLEWLVQQDLRRQVVTSPRLHLSPARPASFGTFWVVLRYALSDKGENLRVFVSRFYQRRSLSSMSSSSSPAKS